MSAPTTSTIGTSGTYSTLATWLADMPADITTGGGAGSYSANLKDQTFSSTSFTLSGVTTDASHTITLGCDSGASFRDNASVLTNSLRVNGSNGSLLTGHNDYGSTLTLGCSNVRLFGLQVENTSIAGDAASVSGGPSALIYDSCIFAATPGSSTRPVVAAGFGASVVERCGIICLGSTGNGLSLSNASNVVSRTTIARTADQSAAGVGISTPYSGCVLTGNAIYNFATPIGGSVPGSSSDYNATDQPSLGTSIPGSHNLLSQSYSGSFLNSGSTPTAVDLRIAGSSPLKDSGVAVAGLTVDIAGTTIGSPPDVGCWEYSSASVAIAYTMTAAPSPGVTGTPVVVTLTPTGGNYTGTITAAPTGSASTGLSAIAKTWSGSNAAMTASFTPAVAGTLTFTGTNSGTLTNASAVNVTISAAPLAVTAIACTVARTSLACSVTASGGTAPYSYAWSWSTLPGGTYAQFGSSSASQALSGLPYRTQRWVKCVVTDSASGTATAGPTGFATRPLHSVFLGLIGDSITGYIDAPTTAAHVSDSIPEDFATTLDSNGAMAGSASPDWLAGASSWGSAPISGVSNIDTYVAAQFATASSGAALKVASIMLGTNDTTLGTPTSASAYGTNLAAICGQWVARGYICLLHYIPYRYDADHSAAILSYNAAIDSLVDNASIFQGDQDVFLMTLNAPTTLLKTDGLHPELPGQALYAKLWADAATRYLERDGRASPPAHKVRGRLGTP